MNQSTDIVIMGAGIAGLTLARQLKLKLPQLQITVLEKNSFPLPEAAIKVGESTVEMGAHYFSINLGLKKHLERNQFFKLGLRYFFPATDNSDITERFEMGSAQLPTPVPTYQIDRGRFENHLYEINKEAGIEILEKSNIKNVELSNDDSILHRIYYHQDNQQKTLQAKWLIDATGRFGLLKRKLDLAEPVTHDSCAAWFRLNCVVDINTWSDSKDWHARNPLNQRYFSTNHLMGRGYWVWLIPLASGSTSIGIVYDPKQHASNCFKNFETTLQWLAIHEPQCHSKLQSVKNQLQDFRWLKNYAYSCKQLYSENRWYITGEAGVFADPFYSPGNDFIALGNTYITDLIARDSTGENTTKHIKNYNHTYLEYFQLLLTHFDGHYQNFDCGHLMIQKILWDTICAFGIPYLLFYTNKFCDLDFMQSIGNKTMSRYKELTLKVQSYFKENADHFRSHNLQNNFLNFSDVIHSQYYGGRIYRQLQMAKKLTTKKITEELQHNIELMEKIAAEILTGKCIVPEYYIHGEGNKTDLWRTTKSGVTLIDQPVSA